MLTRGEIINIDPNGNTCSVRMPVFEGAGNKWPIDATATICIPPGLYGGFKIGDIVVLGFDANYSGSPVVLGKLYIKSDADTNLIGEKEKDGGFINCLNLKVSQEASLPLSTKLTAGEQDVNTVGESSVNTSSLGDLIASVRNIDNRLANLQKTNDANNEKIAEVIVNINSIIDNISRALLTLQAITASEIGGTSSEHRSV